MTIRRILQDRSLIDLVEGGLQRSIGLLTARLRLLPDFIIIGAQRSGTTSLFNYLCQHPEMRPSFPKEVGFFSNYYQRGINWYRSHFPLSTWKSEVEGHSKSKFITGEATPYYLFHPHAPRRASIVIPHARLIVLLRNPIDRAYSHYHHEVRMGVEKLAFEEAINKEEERLYHEVEKLTENENYRSFNYQHYSYLSRGIYIDQIQAWRRCFALEAMLILTSEAFFNEPAKSMSRVLNFLELPSWSLNNLSKKYNFSPYPKINSNVRKRLTTYFQPHNKSLCDYLNVDLGWEK